MHIQGNGISIHYQIDGPENAPTVVLSHSLAANLEMWDAQMSTLLPGFRVLRYDTRGHGQTEAPTGSYTLELLARDLFSLMDGLGIDAAHFVGLSMGGMIGQAAVLENASRFHSISLCDTSSRLPPEALPIWEERIATAQSEGMDAMVESTIERWFSRAFQERCATVVDPIRDDPLHTARRLLWLLPGYYGTQPDRTDSVHYSSHTTDGGSRRPRYTSSST